LTSYNTKVLIVLAISILISTILGVLFPSEGQLFSEYILVILGFLLFLNLIQLDFQDLISIFRKPKILLILSMLKLIIIPVSAYFVTNEISPKYALPVLLLSGISTGLGAPFVTNYVGGRLSIIVGMVIVTSLLVPFLLPTLVYVFFNTEFSIPVFDMISLLVISLIVPLVGSGIIKRYLPKLAATINKSSLPLSIFLMDLINFAIFSKFSSYFFLKLSFVITTTIVAFPPVLYLMNKDSSTKDKFSGLIALSYVNNILVTVFAQQFFGSQVAALAAFYNMPYYMGIILLKILHSKLVRVSSK